MKKAVIFGDRKAGIVEVPDPEPKEDWALVKVHASAMCTEYKDFVAGKKAEFIGHEATGEVVALAQPCSVEVGDRVVILPGYACGTCELCLDGDFVYCESGGNFREFMGTHEGRGTFAQYIVKPSRLLLNIPDNVSYEKATMAIDGIGASFGAIQAIAIGAFDTVLVTGLGPIGLGAVVNCRFRGARVLGVEPFAWRRERARQMGVEEVLDPTDEKTLDKIKDLTDGRGVDCAVDCSGTVQGERLCIDAARRRGRVAFVGECYQDLTIRVSPDLNRKGLMLVGTWCSSMADQSKIMQIIAESPLIDLLISHVMPMSQIQEAFELLASGESGKVVIKPWE